MRRHSHSTMEGSEGDYHRVTQRCVAKRKRVSFPRIVVFVHRDGFVRDLHDPRDPLPLLPDEAAGTQRAITDKHGGSSGDRHESHSLASDARVHIHFHRNHALLVHDFSGLRGFVVVNDLIEPRVVSSRVQQSSLEYDSRAFSSSSRTLSTSPHSIFMSSVPNSASLRPASSLTRWRRDRA